MQKFTQLNDINTASIEGKYLMAALAALTVSKSIRMDGHDLNGRDLTPDAVVKLLQPAAEAMYPDLAVTDVPYEQTRPSLQDEIARILNRRSRENISNTPDFILAEYIHNALQAFEQASLAREKWHGKSLQIEMP